MKKPSKRRYRDTSQRHPIAYARRMADGETVPYAEAARSDLKAFTEGHPGRIVRVRLVPVADYNRMRGAEKALGERLESQEKPDDQYVFTTYGRETHRFDSEEEAMEWAERKGHARWVGGHELLRPSRVPRIETEQEG